MQDIREFCEIANLELAPLKSLTERSPAQREGALIMLEAATDRYGEPDLDQLDDYFASYPVAQVVLGDPGEVVITLLDDGTVEVAEFMVEWPGPGTPVPFRKTRGLIHVRPEGSSVERAAEVKVGAQRLRSLRRRRFKVCSSCGERNPPEWWAGDGICQACFPGVY